MLSAKAFLSISGLSAGIECAVSISVKLLSNITASKESTLHNESILKCENSYGRVSFKYLNRNRSGWPCEKPPTGRGNTLKLSGVIVLCPASIVSMGIQYPFWFSSIKRYGLSCFLPPLSPSGVQKITSSIVSSFPFTGIIRMSSTADSYLEYSTGFGRKR